MHPRAVRAVDIGEYSEGVSAGFGRKDDHAGLTERSDRIRAHGLAGHLGDVASRVQIDEVSAQHVPPVTREVDDDGSVPDFVHAGQRGLGDVIGLHSRSQHLKPRGKGRRNVSDGPRGTEHGAERHHEYDKGHSHHTLLYWFAVDNSPAASRAFDVGT